MSRKMTLNCIGYMPDGNKHLSFSMQAAENRRMPAEITAKEMQIVAGNQVMVKSLEKSGGNHHYIILADLSSLQSFIVRNKSYNYNKKHLEKIIKMMKVIKIQVQLEPEEKIKCLPPGA